MGKFGGLRAERCGTWWEKPRGLGTDYRNGFLANRLWGGLGSTWLKICTSEGTGEVTGGELLVGSATISFVERLCSQNCEKQLSAGRIFMKFDVLSIFLNSVEKIKVLSKYDGYFA